MSDHIIFDMFDRGNMDWQILGRSLMKSYHQKNLLIRLGRFFGAIMMIILQNVRMSPQGIL